MAFIKGKKGVNYVLHAEQELVARLAISTADVQHQYLHVSRLVSCSFCSVHVPSTVFTTNVIVHLLQFTHTKREMKRGNQK